MAWSSTRFTRWGRRSFGAYRRRNMRGRTRGNKRAARSQRDTATVVINIQKTFQVPLAEGATSNAIGINIWAQLKNSNMFESYRGMYDQVKIAGITARIRGLNGSSALTLNNTPTICTAWDRNGLEPSNAAETTAAISYQTVSSYSSAIITNWSPGNAFKVTRHLYPSTISEKSYYAACGALAGADTDRNPAADFLSHTGSNFKPILLIGAYAGFAATAQQSVGLMIEFDITCSFRGLRRYNTTADPDATQIADMAGVFLNGQLAEKQTAAITGQWTRVNNDGDINKGVDGETIPNEVPQPPIKIE